MSLKVLPSVSRLVTQYLRSVAEVQALVNQRVSIGMPGPPFPRVTFDIISGSEVVRSHLESVVVQVSAWSASETQAELLIRTVRAAMMAMPEAYHDDAVVTDVSVLNTETADHDPEYQPAPWRYRCDLLVTLHPS